MRRRRSVKDIRNAARDGRRDDSESAERIAGLERVVIESTRSLDALAKRVDHLESQLDYIASKVRPA